MNFSLRIVGLYTHLIRYTVLFAVAFVLAIIVCDSATLMPWYHMFSKLKGARDFVGKLAFFLITFDVYI